MAEQQPWDDAGQFQGQLIKTLQDGLEKTWAMHRVSEEARKLELDQRRVQSAS